MAKKSKHVKAFDEARIKAREAAFRLKDLTNMPTVMNLLKKHGGYSVATLPAGNVKAFTKEAIERIKEEERRRNEDKEIL